jgi:hypothetical protein
MRGNPECGSGRLRFQILRILQPLNSLGDTMKTYLVLIFTKNHVQPKAYYIPGSNLMDALNRFFASMREVDQENIMAMEVYP